MTRSLVLVPPSEGKLAGGTAREGATTFAVLDEGRRAITKALVAAVAKASDDVAARLLGVRGPLLVRYRDATKRLADEDVQRLPAWRRYSGVVWSHLDPASLSTAQRRRLLVPSGLYGLTTADDLVADYRLKMNVVLPKIGRVDAFWRDGVSQVIAAHAHRRTIFDLLPAEHRRVLDPAYLADVHLVRVDFVDADGAGAAGHAAKAAKGVLAGQLLRDGDDVLGNFSWEGWSTRRIDGHWQVRAPRRRHLG